jgi:hypothetical protein
VSRYLGISLARTSAEADAISDGLITPRRIVTAHPRNQLEGCCRHRNSRLRLACWRRLGDAAPEISPEPFVRQPSEGAMGAATWQGKVDQNGLAIAHGCGIGTGCLHRGTPTKLANRNPLR